MPIIIWTVGVLFWTVGVLLYYFEETVISSTVVHTLSSYTPGIKTQRSMVSYCSADGIG